MALEHIAVRPDGYAEAEGRDYEPLTQRGARVHAVCQAKAMFAEMRERLELARDAWGESRE